MPNYYDIISEPAVVSAPLSKKFHGSQAAAKRYAEGYQGAQKNVAEKRDKVAPYVAAGLVGAMAAPVAIDLAATATPAVAKAVPTIAKDLAIGIPSFEVVDRIPTLIGQERATIQAGNLAEKGFRAISPDGDFKEKVAPYVNQAGQFAAAVPVAGFGELASRGIANNLVNRGAIESAMTATQKANKVARALNKEVKGTEIVDSSVTQNILAGKLGWAPRQSRIIGHNSESPISKLESTFPAGDIVKRDAPLGHVGGTSTETNLGFIGKRPFHLRSIKPVEMNKPMVQLNESVGNGKNAVRNEILKYADQSGADAVNFSNIKDNTLSNQDVYAVFKDVDVKPKLSEAERLGIPKGERSNPKALEDPQYGGYRQGNNKYNAAVESGNVEEAQRLRDLHFKNKTPNNRIVDYMGNPHKVYHGSPEDGYIFDDSKRGVDDVIYFSTDKAYADQYTVPRNKGQKGMVPTRNSREFYLYGKEPINVGSDMYYGSVQDELIHNGANGLNADSVYGLDAVTNPLNPSSGIEFGVLRRNQFKLTDPITKTKTGKIIPIVKRDNFRNPDIRYKQGGILKAQDGSSKKGKALQNINYEAIPDSTFTRQLTGIGDIEYFSSEHPEGITYPNGFHKEHPNPGKDVILYNPKTNDEQDIRLDALHIMPKDPTYDVLNTLYRNAAKNSDVMYNAENKYKEDVEKYGKNNIDSFEQYFNNEADGLLRNMLIEGSPKYIASKRYYPDKGQLKDGNKHLVPYISEIQKYLETGERPGHILPPAVISSNK